MKNVALLLPVALLAVACTSKSVQVCEKLEKVDALPMGGVDRCQAMWNADKERDAAAFDKRADCVLAAADKAAVQACPK